MKFTILASAVALAAASAASAEVKIDPFKEDLFKGCVQGDDIGAMTKVSNPILLLGSVVHTGKVLNGQGQIVDGLVRKPLALPLITTDSASPDVSTCEHNFKVSADGNISFLGFGLNASKSDIYKVKVRLVARQKLAPVPEQGAQVQPWLSTVYKPQFTSVVSGTPAAVKDFFIFDNISIYLLDVEKYRKVGGGLTGVFGVVTGGANYAKDEDFKGTKIIVTGDTVPLTREMYATTAPVVIAQLPRSDQALMTFSVSDEAEVRSALMEASRGD